jgi:hypothetical protein
VPLVVVNMIPANRSGESNQDSEPSITVDPSDPSRIAGSAFTPNLPANPNAPIYVSTNGGMAWALASIVPSTGFGDISIRFAASGTLYAGILFRPSAALRMRILSTPNFVGGATMAVLVDRTPPAGRPDQPWVQAMTALGGSGAGRDKVYVGSNDRPGIGTGFTATIDRSVDGVGATPPPPSNFTINVVETRPTTWFAGSGPQDAPPVRPGLHPDGTVYAVICAPRSTTGTTILVSDIVVVRDDNWAAGASPWTALTDPSDGLAGRLVRTGRNVPWFTIMGQERLGPNLTIAVDPRNSDRVYIAFVDTAGSNSTIHVLRSTNRGASWSASDLRTINNAWNPGLAINSRGRVGLLYQQLTGSGASQRWVTHLELTSNDWSSAATDFVLSTVPANTPVQTFQPYIGDYANLVSLGKDFYGIFSANNTPNSANFPSGVTYARNANFGSQTLFANDGVTVVPVSIDPFFVRHREIEPREDFYVRDWTDSATSGDNGVEPSTHPVFYIWSDVWNRRKNKPGTFNANDQPDNEYPKMGMGNSGKNFGFVRVRRNESGSAVDVTAHFLVSPFGCGSAYQDAWTDPDLSIHFGAGDLVKTPGNGDGYEWHIGPTMTDHLCFAVEITAPGDPIVSPSLLGHAPGWPSTDLMVLNDNNKAQRNMYPPPTSGDGSSACFYALVRNAATFRRDLVLDYRAADPRVERQLGKLAVQTVGERGVKRASSGRLVLAGMEPGERRWVSLTLPVRTGNGRTPLPVLFDELVGTRVVNGFAIAPVPSPLGAAIRFNAELHAFRFGRLGDAFGITETKRLSAQARKLAGQTRVTGPMYVALLKEQTDVMKKAVGEVLAQAGRDPFGLKSGLSRLEQAAGRGAADALAPAHLCFLGGLDAFLTMLQLERGDPASVLHNVEWQRYLFTEVNALAKLDGAGDLVKLSDKFIRDWEARKAGPAQFAGFVKRAAPILRRVAKAAPRLPLARSLDNLEKRLGSTDEAQLAHRDVLLRLASLQR